MRSDPTDTGGLFVGRRPGTAPVRFKAVPQRGTQARQRVDGSLAGVLLAAMIGVSLLCWGPIPLACLWVGSEINYLTGSVFLGIILAFLALFPMLFGALAILRQLDNAWILVRRAAEDPGVIELADRKSTRLNSSHPSISYAVFCFEK